MRSKNSRYILRLTPKITKLRMFVIICCLFVTGVSIPSNIQAQAKVGTTGTQFLELGVSARAMGMGEAFAAVVDDISAVYYNPAALTSLLGKEVMVTYIDMPADVEYGFFGVGIPLESIGGVLGIGAYGLSSGKMNVTDYGTSQAGNGQQFDFQDLAMTASYGRYLTDRFSIGVTFRYINESTAGYSTSGWSADVGTDYNTGFRGFRIAMSITNFGPDLRFVDDDIPLPINFRFGGSINVIEQADHLLTLAAEGTHPSDNLEKYNSGLEYTFKDRFVLRGGGRFNYDSDGLTLGGGIKLPFGDEGLLRVDYAFQDFDILTEVHRFSMTLAF